MLNILYQLQETYNVKPRGRTESLLLGNESGQGKMAENNHLFVVMVL